MGRVEGEVVVAEGKPLLKVPLTLEAALCSPPLSLSLCVCAEVPLPPVDAGAL